MSAPSSPRSPKTTGKARRGSSPKLSGIPRRTGTGSQKAASRRASTSKIPSRKTGKKTGKRKKVRRKHKRTTSSVPASLRAKVPSRGKRDNVRVMARFRPMTKKEQKRGRITPLQVTFADEKHVELHMHGPEVDLSKAQSSRAARQAKQTFVFDRVFGMDTTQEQMFADLAQSTVDDVLQGFNGTIFAYGQTGSGKTFSMFGEPYDNLEGLIPRSAKYLFDQLAQKEEVVEVAIKCGFLEIYQEHIIDLLNPQARNLKVRETVGGSVFVEGLREEYITAPDDVLRLIRMGETSRSVSYTDMNEASSRSHSLLVINVKQTLADGSVLLSKLNLADLAGSERLKKSKAQGDTLKETQFINLSLSALGNCINALTEKRRKHIPFRDSRLTRLLQDSLGGNTKTTLLVTCSPHGFNFEETISTLRFAERAKKIRNKVRVNKQLTVPELLAVIERLEAIIKEKDKRIQELELGNGLPTSPATQLSAVSEDAAEDDSKDADDDASTVDDDASVHDSTVTSDELNDVLAAYGYIELLEGSLARALDVIEVYRSKARSIVGKPESAVPSTTASPYSSEPNSPSVYSDDSKEDSRPSTPLFGALEMGLDTIPRCSVRGCDQPCFKGHDHCVEHIVIDALEARALLAQISSMATANDSPSNSASNNEIANRLSQQGGSSSSLSSDNDSNGDAGAGAGSAAPRAVSRFPPPRLKLTSPLAPRPVRPVDITQHLEKMNLDDADADADDKAGAPNDAGNSGDAGSNDLQEVEISNQRDWSVPSTPASPTPLTPRGLPNMSNPSPPVSADADSKSPAATDSATSSTGIGTSAATGVSTGVSTSMSTSAAGAQASFGSAKEEEQARIISELRRQNARLERRLKDMKNTWQSHVDLMMQQNELFAAMSKASQSSAGPRFVRPVQSKFLKSGQPQGVDSKSLGRALNTINRTFINSQAGRERVILQGYVYKQTRWISTWSRRYLIIRTWESTEPGKTMEKKAWIDNYKDREEAERDDVPRGSIVVTVDLKASLATFNEHTRPVAGFEIRSENSLVRLRADLESGTVVPNERWVQVINDTVSTLGIARSSSSSASSAKKGPWTRRFSLRNLFSQRGSVTGPSGTAAGTAGKSSHALSGLPLQIIKAEDEESEESDSE